ncbi:hypothetical protein ACIPSK_07480 [Rhizobium sp. LARHSG275]
MQEGLAEKIKAIGHWRVNIRPLQPIDPPLAMNECHERVAKANVSLRGWDYPHIQRNTEHGGAANVGTYAENWCDWSNHVEFWRMYRSGQFLHYRALSEDLSNEGQNRPAGPALSVLGAVYTVTEATEFLSRLYNGGLYKDGASINVTLGKSADRQLWISEFDRMPFYDEKRTNAEELVIERSLLAAELEGEAGAVSLSILLELFDHFGWNPDTSLIQRDQERFYKRQW